jgi:spore maturation protein CgeB
MRDYEAMNFKALVLTDKTPFTPGRDVVLYRDKKDLEQKIKYYLEHEKEREKIALQGYKTITRGKYTYRDRMEEMLRVIDEHSL